MSRSDAKPQPDLFTLPERRTEPALVPSRPVLLPDGLASSLRLLTDEDLKRLRVTVAEEVARRALTPANGGNVQRERPPKPTAGARSTQGRRNASPPATSAVTAGKASAIRAAFRAGLKPATIARQFGVAQSLVRQVLQGEGKS